MASCSGTCSMMSSASFSGTCSMMSSASNSSMRFFNGWTSWYGTRHAFCAIGVASGFIGILI